MHTTRCAAIMLLVAALAAAGRAQDAENSDNQDQTADPQVLAGHSYHGEAFNEGPRQQAYLMEGLGRVKFPVTTSQPAAQEFVAQGVAQLHGFWYFEAERSFRQAAALDPDCAMAYWGMALANRNNAKRAKGFIAEAVKRKDKIDRREQMYIEALDEYLKADPKNRKQRAEKYTKALERLIYEYPDDVEAKAFLALQLWNNRSSSLPITSYLAVDALLEQVFAAEPMHPAHHYRIHLWDYERPAKALEAAARCGQSLPAIAHMWHMPGHIYSRLKRYQDACWQQEASARVDHAHMMRDRVMPDQIHNFAHNNEWLIRNLNYVGRVRDAVELAKNMIELPRHPKYNTPQRRGSAYYGRVRLLETLNRYELWEEMIALGPTPYLEPTDDHNEQVKRLRYLGSAHFRQGDLEGGAALWGELFARLEKEQAERQRAVDAAAEKAGREKADDKKLAKAKQDAAKPFDSKISLIEKALNELEGHWAVAEDQLQEGLDLLKKAGGVDAMYLAQLRQRTGESDQAVADAERYVSSHQHEVQPLALLVELLWQAGKKDEARRRFDQLREISADIDLQSPVFDRLAPIAAEFDHPADWTLAKPPADDVGQRPALDALGPFRWQPSPAPDFTLTDADGEPLSLKQFQGRPLVVIFYLGYGCLHCAEQLQAFAPQVEPFRDAGLDVIAVSTDDRDGLRQSIENYKEGDLPIRLVSDAELGVFKAYRCYDDFEKQPLHGTFLLDANGLVRWQDISYEPFMDPKFVLGEAQRLLAQPCAEP